MPNGESGNWIRFLLTLESFNILYGTWPTQICLYPFFIAELDSNPLLMAKIIGQDTLKDLAEKVVGCHKPIHFNWAAKFGLSPWRPSPEPQVAQQQVDPQIVKPNPAEPQKPTPKETSYQSGEGSKKP